MNIKISANQLRFRIKQDEVEILTQNGRLDFSINLGVQSFAYSILLADLGRNLALDIQESTWKLLVDRKNFLQFLNSLPSRTGIEQKLLINDSQIELILDVDLRRKH